MKALVPVPRHRPPNARYLVKRGQHKHGDNSLSTRACSKSNTISITALATRKHQSHNSKQRQRRGQPTAKRFYFPRNPHRNKEKREKSNYQDHMRERRTTPSRQSSTADEERSANKSENKNNKISIISRRIMAPDEDFASLFCGCLGGNILDAIDLTERPLEVFTNPTTTTKGQSTGSNYGDHDVTTPITANGDIDDIDDVSTGSHSTNNDITSRSVKFTTQHPPAEVISIYPTYSVNPASISISTAAAAAAAAAAELAAASPRSRTKNRSTKPIRAKQIVPPGQEDRSSSMMKSFENSFLSMQVELLHGLTGPQGMLEDRIKKRKLQREKQRKLEEARMKKNVEKEQKQNQQIQASTASTTDGASANGLTENSAGASCPVSTTNAAAAATTDGAVDVPAAPLCEVPTMDLSDDEADAAVT